MQQTGDIGLGGESGCQVLLLPALGQVPATTPRGLSLSLSHDIGAPAYQLLLSTKLEKPSVCWMIPRCPPEVSLRSLWYPAPKSIQPPTKPVCPAKTNQAQSFQPPNHLYPTRLCKRPATWLAVGLVPGPRRVLQSHQGLGSLQCLLIFRGSRHRGTGALQRNRPEENGSRASDTSAQTHVRPPSSARLPPVSTPNA